MKGKKTFLAAIVAGIAAALAWALGEISFADVWIAWQGVAAAIFLRMGLKAEGGFLAGYKTYISQVIAMLGTVGQYLANGMGPQEAVTSILMAIAAMFFKAGEKKEAVAKTGGAK